jgi:hypothetical protein
VLHDNCRVASLITSVRITRVCSFRGALPRRHRDAEPAHDIAEGHGSLFFGQAAVVVRIARVERELPVVPTEDWNSARSSLPSLFFVAGPKRTLA